MPIKELLLTRNTTLPLIMTAEARRKGPEGTGSRTAVYDGCTVMVNVVWADPILFVAFTTTVYGEALATAVHVMTALDTSMSIPDGADTRLHVTGTVPCWK